MIASGTCPSISAAIRACRSTRRGRGYAATTTAPLDVSRQLIYSVEPNARLLPAGLAVRDARVHAQHGRPALVHGLVHGFRRVAVAFEVAVLELYARALRTFGDECHLDLGDERRIVFPLRRDLPRPHEAPRW